MGADVVLNYKEQDVVAEIKRLTGGGADVAIEALGTAGDVRERAAQRASRRHACRASASTPGTCRCRSTRSRAGLGDHTIVTTLCPGGKERMRRLMSIVAAKRFPFRELVTHSFKLDDIEAAYDLFANQRDGVHEGRDPAVTRRQPANDAATRPTR